MSFSARLNWVLAEVRNGSGFNLHLGAAAATEKVKLKITLSRKAPPSEEQKLLFADIIEALGHKPEREVSSHSVPK